MGVEVDMAVSIPSSFSPLKYFQALIEECVLEENHMRSFRKRFQIPIETKICLPHQGEKAYAFAHGHMCFYKADFIVVSIFPSIHLFKSY